jgi:hypothetical protein
MQTSTHDGCLGPVAGKDPYEGRPHDVSGKVPLQKGAGENAYSIILDQQVAGMPASTLILEIGLLCVGVFYAQN